MSSFCEYPHLYLVHSPSASTSYSGVAVIGNLGTQGECAPLYLHCINSCPDSHCGVVSPPMNISAILPCVKRPSRYLGTEVNSRHKPWQEAELRTALVFPDLYEIGMSHLGLQILYGILNDRTWALADRSFCPDHDMEALMRRKKIPAWGLESRKPLVEFDIVAFTLPYELCYINILTILDLSGIPFRSEDRIEGRWPLILGGGSCSLNPEPVADFFDAVLVGDGEEAIVEIAKCARDWKHERNSSKQELLEALSRIDGIYIPSFYRSVPLSSGFHAAEPVHAGADSVKRRILPELHGITLPSKPLVPYTQIVHDRLGIEIARGCTRGCRFCQAGIIYRPVRERPLEQILSMAAEGLAETGWDEVSLLSLSTGDYSCLFPLIHELMKKQRSRHVSISLPSLRVGTLTEQIMQEIKSVRKTGFTLAPEAGSERLRLVVNKGITEEDLLETAALAYSNGWSHMKLYFMIGLPTETEEDVYAIAALAKKVREQGGPVRGKGGRKKQQVTVSVGTFVPKPHTPFQWEEQIDPDESKKYINMLRDTLRGRAFNVKWHDPRQSFLEGVFSRGDRRLSGVIVRAWQAGARLDAWTDSMRPDLYLAAGSEEDIDLSAYLARRDIDSRLPWDHLSSGADPEYIRDQRAKAFDGIYTPDCRTGKCHRCGTCDFKKIKPVVFTRNDTPADKTNTGEPDRARLSSQQEYPKNTHEETAPRHFCRLGYSKTGEARFLGHLEMVHAFHRAARRAGIPLAYSAGFHPMPRVAFGQPLSLGMESLMEEAVMELTHPLPSNRIVNQMNASLPDGLTVNEARISGSRMKIREPEASRYIIWLSGFEPADMQTALKRFEETATVPVQRERKGGKITLDAKKQVKSLRAVSGASARENTDLTRPEKAWLARIQKESCRIGTSVILELNRTEGPVLKPHEITAAATGCGQNRKPVELFEIMQILKSVHNAPGEQTFSAPNGYLPE